MILIVDDLPENIIALKSVLEKNDFQVDTASSGEEALKKILKNSYVLIILDVQMPGMDGFEVAEAITGYSKAKDTAIIFLSAANIEKNFITKGYSSGGLDYITKPVDTQILLLKVKTFYRIYDQARRLNEMQESLLKEIDYRRDAENKKDEFISVASHELKTPLTSIKGYLQVLERSMKKNEPEKSYYHLKKAQNQVEKLNELVSELLDISKIESGELPLNKIAFSPEKLLNNAVENLQQVYPGCRICTEGKIPREILADEMRIEQVLANFLTNAIKYSPSNSPIIIRTKFDDHYFSVSVIDKGMGMDESSHKKLFTKFYRSEEVSNKIPGLGIGLFISKKIIERHGGKIGVNTEHGKGSEFFFQLPLE
ncbi:MAG: hybrid sensor histidine kinase/response regulator [Ginsengibacter sp.]